MKGNIEILSLFLLNSLFILSGARKKTWGCPTGWTVEGAMALQGFSVWWAGKLEKRPLFRREVGGCEFIRD
jgi:hypothetical protein